MLLNESRRFRQLRRMTGIDVNAMAVGLQVGLEGERLLEAQEYQRVLNQHAAAQLVGFWKGVDATTARDVVAQGHEAADFLEDRMRLDHRELDFRVFQTHVLGLELGWMHSHYAGGPAPSPSPGRLDALQITQDRVLLSRKWYLRAALGAHEMRRLTSQAEAVHLTYLRGVSRVGSQYSAEALYREYREWAEHTEADLRSADEHHNPDDCLRNAESELRNASMSARTVVMGLGDPPVDSSLVRASSAWECYPELAGFSNRRLVPEVDLKELPPIVRPRGVRSLLRGHPRRQDPGPERRRGQA